MSSKIHQITMEGAEYFNEAILLVRIVSTQLKRSPYRSLTDISAVVIHYSMKHLDPRNNNLG